MSSSYHLLEIDIAYPLPDAEYLNFTNKTPLLEFYQAYFAKLTTYAYHFSNYYHIDNLKLRTVNLSPSLTVAELQSSIKY